MQIGEPGRSTWGIYRFTLDFREFLREIEIRGNAAGDQPCAATECQILYRPLNENENATLERNQIGYVDKGRKHRPPPLRVQSPPGTLCRSNERVEAPADPLLFARPPLLHRLLPAWRPGPLQAKVFLFHPSLKPDRLLRKCPDSLESSGQVLL